MPKFNFLLFLNADGEFGKDDSTSWVLVSLSLCVIIIRMMMMMTIMMVIFTI